MTLNTDAIANQNGSLLADTTLTIRNTGTLDNSSGALASSGLLDIAGSGLNLINRGNGESGSNAESACANYRRQRPVALAREYGSEQ